jgi:hypothetical protein
VQDTLLMNIMHRSKKKKARVSAFTQISSKGLICVIVVHDFEAPRKKNTQENTINRIAVGIFLHPLQMQFDVAHRQGEHAKGRREDKHGRTRLAPLKSRGLAHTNTHTYLGNVLLHTHHLFSHPFARDYGTTPH